jgi:hypothetical protein
MTRTDKVAGISGSLRAGSFNTAALRAAQELAPDTLDIGIVTLEEAPLFNADIEARGWPPRVQELRDRVGNADAVIFTSPEYNYSDFWAPEERDRLALAARRRRAAEREASRDSGGDALLRGDCARAGASALDRLLQRNRARRGLACIGRLGLRRGHDPFRRRGQGALSRVPGGRVAHHQSVTIPPASSTMRMPAIVSTKPVSRRSPHSGAGLCGQKLLTRLERANSPLEASNG